MYAVCMHTDIAHCGATRASGALVGAGALAPFERFQGARKTDSGRIDLGDIANAPLGALQGSGLEGAFHAWTGRSGKRYIFTIASPHELDHEALRDAVIIGAFCEHGATRRALFVGEAKDIPQDLRRSGAAIEVHYHLLAATAQARLAMIEDLAGEGHAGKA